MPSCLTGGRSRQCSAGQISGGNKVIYLLDKTQFVSLTLDGTGAATAITLVAPLTDVFYKVEFYPNTAQYTEAMTNTDCSTAVTQTFNMIFKGRNQSDRNFIMELADCCCGLIAIHKEATGRLWIWGYGEGEEIFLNTNDADTGTTLTDSNQEALSLQAIATIKAIEWVATEASIPV